LGAADREQDVGKGPGHKWVTRAVLAIAVLAVGIQLIPVERDNPSVRRDVAAPEAVDKILRAACYDCHSHETRWPWYSRVAPMSFLVARHVHEGRGHLNFSEWPILDFDAQDELFEHIVKEVGEGKMPERSYTLLHPEARLTEAQREAIVSWAKGE
jgi:hypothetical protein